MSQSIHLALSVFQHYLNKAGIKITFPRTFQPQTIRSDLLMSAEEMVLGTKPQNQTQNQPLQSIFSTITFDDQKQSSIAYYHAKPLSPASIFPDANPPQNEMAELWKDFAKALSDIPASHQENLGLWLDHFDTALQCYTTNIPCPYSDEISFYDFVKAVSAFVVALATTENTEEPILLLQGDFFGIQDFIFSGGSQSNKGAAKLLRGRSFQVSLFTELAALKLLNACGLPATSQIMNAAGKFLIVAPNTQAVKNAIKNTQAELNQWFIENTFGLIGLGIAEQTASTVDFAQNNYKTLVDDLFKQLEIQKLRRLNLLNTPSVQEVSYPYGVCEMNSHFPAQANGRSLMSEDQIEIGKLLAEKQRIILCDENADINENYKTQMLNLTLFGYKVIFTNSKKDTKNFGYPVKLQQIHRFWDFSLPENTQAKIWNGYARRYINAYVPFNHDDTIKTFDDIASQNEGQNALMTLKGDVDNLGTIFQKGINPANIAKMAALSRQMNQFFSLWLPAYCAEHSQNMYTVFAGGDDFFLIGPWYSTQKVAFAMQQAFARYVADNPEIHFSVGMVMSKVGLPVPRLGDLAEEALEKAKGIDSGKNAVTIFNRTVKWDKWQPLCDLEQEIHRLAKVYNLSTAYIYSLIKLSKMSEDAQEGNMEANIWYSHFLYKTTRYVVDKLKKDEQDLALTCLAEQIGQKGLKNLKGNFYIPLCNYLYSVRKSENK